MKKNYEDIWEEHKAKILIGGVIGGILLFIFTRKTRKIPAIVTEAVNEVCFSIPKGKMAVVYICEKEMLK